ncbi:MAG TPA: hypothetical protein VHC94_19220 [Nitrobacter sp.]|nr:hypothetical protein [Nitrobacter sp.]
MIDLQWLSDELCTILRWQLEHPGDHDGPEVPWAGQRVWGIFLDVHATRGSNGFGANPISYGEIESWSRLRREPVRPFEMDIIRALDIAYLEAVAKKAEAQATPEQPQVSGRKLSPALFDAVFAGLK